MSKKILVVEDEDSIRDFVVLNLKRAGFEVVDVPTAEEALEVFSKQEHAFSVALLDIMLPGMDGVSLCKALREKNAAIGIVMLTAKTQENDKILGLTTGADDYITKPFSPSELVARLESLCRRVELVTKSRLESSPILKSGPFCLDHSTRILTKNDETIFLTQVEYQIIDYFMRNPGTSFDRTAILHKVWGTSYVGDPKVVDVNIRRLRMKLEDDPGSPEYIVTVWGYGYRWGKE